MTGEKIPSAITIRENRRKGEREGTNVSVTESDAEVAFGFLLDVVCGCEHPPWADEDACVCDLCEELHFKG